MKGFPNQVAELTKIATAVHALVELVDHNEDAKDDGVYGQALVRTGVAGTGHRPMPIEEYLRQQLRREPSNQSFRTTARGLRELFRILGFIDDSGSHVVVTDAGREAAQYADQDLDRPQIEFWRRAIRNMTHAGTTGERSHPYQVLLRLVARKPGITRAKCALALEARNDSPTELERIGRLADLEEDAICRQIGATKSNWDNAKKVLPKFAEQLGDVIRTGQSYVLAAAPGHPEAPARELRAAEPPVARYAGRVGPRAPRASRAVTPETIGRAGTQENFDEVAIPPDLDPTAAREAVRQRLDRLRRHNVIVRALAARLREAGAQLFEDPFDVLALIARLGILVEVKTLDGSAADERDRVQEALAQLLYYEAFVTAPVAGEADIHKVACFERPISQAHQDWLGAAGIGTLWLREGNRFAGNALAACVLGPFLQEIR